MTKIDKPVKEVVHAACGQPVFYRQTFHADFEVSLRFPYRNRDAHVADQPCFSEVVEVRDKHALLCLRCDKILRHVPRRADVSEAVQALITEGIIKAN